MYLIKSAVTAALLAASLPAATITYTAVGTAGGQPVNASAIFTTGLNSVSITINNNLNDPTSVVQAISDLLFTISTGQNTGTISSSSGVERTINSNGTYTLGSPVSTGWSLTTQGSSLYLNVLGTAIGPAHLIIGGPNASNVYASAGGSIAGNSAHNPFLSSGTTFSLNVPGVTAASTITAAQFSFGTTAGVTVNGTAAGGGGDVIPEPGTLTLIGLGAAALGLVRFRRQASS